MSLLHPEEVHTTGHSSQYQGLSLKRSEHYIQGIKCLLIAFSFPLIPNKRFSILVSCAEFQSGCPF